MAVSLSVAAAVAAAGVGVAGIAAADGEPAHIPTHTPAHTPAAASPRLIERSACASPPAEPGAPAPGSPGGTDQVVSVDIRPTAVVRLDADGGVITAWTNTGCAPRATDHLFVELADGSIVAADADLAARRWVGDFRDAGVAVVQPEADRP